MNVYPVVHACIKTSCLLVSMSVVSSLAAASALPNGPVEAPAAQATSTDQKVIKDPAEYNAYIAALNTTDPAQKAAAMEAFITQYPASIVLIDALEQAMAAYQQAGNTAKVGETAGRILALEPKNIRALAVLTAIDRAQATQGNAQSLAQLSDLSARGLQALPNWQNSEGLSDADFTRLTQQMAEIFNGAAGFAALQKKNYAAARDFYLKSAALDPNNLQDVYQLSIAELEMTPLDPRGFWYVAKASNLAEGNDAAVKAISSYGRAKYKRYHGSLDGWEQMVSGSTSQSVPPDGFSVTPAPTPPELAVNAVRDYDPATMSFSDWEFILSYRDASPANKQAADRVWQTIQDKQKNGQISLQLRVKIISASSTSIQAAITDENEASNTADLELTLEKPVTKAPAAGSLVSVIGVLTDYRLNPFVFVMEKGRLAANQ
jgi:tetratricopeptide (TPR) repeat protein